MRRIFTLLLTLGMSIGLLIGCSDTSEPAPSESAEENQSSEEANEEVVTITISENEGEEVLSEKEVVIEDGSILMDVMKENYDIEEDGGFITNIDGVEAVEDEQQFWAIIVNDEMAEVGAEDYELSANDDVVFDLQSWE